MLEYFWNQHPKQPKPCSRCWKWWQKNGPDNVSSKQYIWQPQENLHNFVSAPWWPDSGVHASYRGRWHSSDQHNQGGGDFGNCQVRNYEIFSKQMGKNIRNCLLGWGAKRKIVRQACRRQEKQRSRKDENKERSFDNLEIKIKWVIWQNTC